MSVIRIVTLPRELQTSEQVGAFVTDVLFLGGTTSVQIVNRSAIVHLVNHYPYSEECFKDGAGVIIPASALPEPIHDDDGETMHYIKIVACDDWNSIYVPVIPAKLSMNESIYNDDQSIAALFQDHLQIGVVSRVDIVKKRLNTLAAYVHFTSWYDTPYVNHVRRAINQDGQFLCRGAFDGPYFSHDKFIYLKPNLRPIPAATADMNIHQLAARVAYLEDENLKLMRLLNYQVHC